MAESKTAPDVMLRFADVVERTGLSRTTIWRKVRAGTFPAPIALTENSVGWKSEWVDDWVNALPRVPYAPGPEASAA